MGKKIKMNRKNICKGYKHLSILYNIQETITIVLLLKYQRITLKVKFNQCTCKKKINAYYDHPPVDMLYTF